MVRQYKATETAFVEWVLGNPYSNAVRPDIVMRCNGGLSGLGRHKKSFIIPVKNTPGASRSTKLQMSEGAITMERRGMTCTPLPAGPSNVVLAIRRERKYVS
jgi:hypothetical protein